MEFKPGLEIRFFCGDINTTLIIVLIQLLKTVKRLGLSFALRIIRTFCN